MTRVVVQRGGTASNSSQNRASGTPVNSAAINGASSSTLLSNSSSQSVVSVAPGDEAVDEELKLAELSTSHVGEIQTQCFEASSRQGPVGGLEVKANERESFLVQASETTSSSDGIHDWVDVGDSRRQAEFASHISGEGLATELSEPNVAIDGQESIKGKEVDDEECQPGNVVAENNRNVCCATEGSGAAQQREAEDSLSGRRQTSGATGLPPLLKCHSTSPTTNQLLSSSSLPTQGGSCQTLLSLASTAHAGVLIDGGLSHVHELEQPRPHSLPTSLEAVGCSYIGTPTSCSSAPSVLSRRGCWVGSSGSAIARGGLSRRPLRGKPARNSPDSSRPSSPKSYGEGDGYNSADEQSPWTSGPSIYENSEEREHQFDLEIRRLRNLELRRMAEDGNCLFRAVADQVYGDAEMYDETRQMCIDYMEKERDHFSQFVTESFTAYCKRKRRDKVYGNNLEIQAMAEMFNRPIHIYSYGTEPFNIFHGSYETDLPPIRLSYHRGNHYNSLVDPSRPAVGVGLGFGSFRGINVDREQVKAALKAQQDQQIEKALLAEGRFYSDMELTEQEMERMVMEASRAEYLEEEKHRHHVPLIEESSTSAAAEPSSSGTTAGCPRSRGPPPSLAAAGSDSGLTSHVRMLLSMGFSYLQAVEAFSIFGDDLNNMICYLLETGSNSFGDGETTYRMKGKAAES